MPRPVPPPPKPTFTVGLDLGQAQDFTALAIVESTRQLEHSVRYLHRWPLGTSYPKIVADVCQIVRLPPLEYPTLVVDATGIGRAVTDLFREADLWANLKPVTIASGTHTTFEAGYHRVPKKELVSSLQVVLQSQRIGIAKQLPYAATLVREMQNFRVTITAAANETFEAASREGAHDDLVLAVAMPCWWVEQHPPRDDEEDEAFSVGTIPDTLGRRWGW